MRRSSGSSLLHAVAVASLVCATAAQAQDSSSASFPDQPGEPSAPQAPARKVPTPPTPPLQVPSYPQQPGQYPPPRAHAPAPPPPHQPTYPGYIAPIDPHADYEGSPFPAPTRAPTPQGIDPNLPPPPPGICSDKRSSPYESDVDCGGLCRPCNVGQECRTWQDCISGMCAMTECIERVHERGAPVPGGYRAETSDNDRAATARLAGGLFFFGSYGAAYAVALSMPSQLSWLYVPLVGPWGALGKANLFEQDLTVKALLVTDGAMQAAGAILWLSGYLLRGEQLLRLSADSVQSATLGQVYVAPVRTEDGFGVNVGGLF